MDKFYKNDARLFQVMENRVQAGGIWTAQSSSGPLADALVHDLPQVEYATVTTPADNVSFAVNKEKNLKASGKYAGKDFFKIFSYDLIQGAAGQVLTDEHSIVLSETLAMKLFGGATNAVGKTVETVEFQDRQVYKVSGIYRDPGPILGVLVVYRQVRFIQTKNLGYDRDNVISFFKEGQLRDGKQQQSFLAEARKIPGIIQASSIGHSLTGHNNGSNGVVWEGKDPNDKTEFEVVAVDYGMLEALGISMEKGRSFARNFGSDSTKIIFNEAAIRFMGLKDPVGKKVKLWDKQGASWPRSKQERTRRSSTGCGSCTGSCLGLFGLAAFTADRRRKEIGIRKVLGASARSVVYLLSKDFLKLTLIAITLAFPLAWWMAGEWLNSFAYRIHLGSDIFLMAGYSIILVALMTVSYQAIKAALSNPVTSLKAE